MVNKIKIPELTLCLIVKDEAAFLPRCLAEAGPVCGDIVIVDTGSTDGSQDIARSHTDTFIQTTMDGGYSAARNLALEQVKTPWVLFLDVDEEFPATEWPRVAALIEQAPDDHLAYTVLRFNLTAVGAIWVDRPTRLFRSHPDIRYRRLVGESVEDAVQDMGGVIASSGLVLNHPGNVRPVADRTAKLRRYLDLTEKQIADYPDLGLWPAYAGFLHRALGNFEQAVEWSSKAVESDPSAARVWAYHGHVLRAADRPHDALAAFQTAAKLAPEDSIFLNMVGVLHLMLNELEEAEAAFTGALALEPDLLHAEINRGLIRQAREEYEAAAEILRGVARRNSGLLLQDWRGRVEIDHFTYLFNETVPHFAGLAYHLAYCEFMAASSRTEVRYPVDGRFAGTR